MSNILTIEVIDPEAIEAFLSLKKEQELYLQLSDCERIAVRVIPASQVSAYPQARAVDSIFVEEATNSSAQIEQRLGELASEMTNPVGKWNIHIEFAGLEHKEEYELAKCTEAEFITDLRTRFPHIADISLIGKDGDDLYFVTAKDIETYLSYYSLTPILLSEALEPC